MARADAASNGFSKTHFAAAEGTEVEKSFIRRDCLGRLAVVGIEGRDEAATPGHRREIRRNVPTERREADSTNNGRRIPCSGELGIGRWEM